VLKAITQSSQSNMHQEKLILTTALFLPSLLALTAADADEVETFHAAARGFGDVRVEARFFGEGNRQASWTTFHGQNAAHARVEYFTIVSENLK